MGPWVSLPASSRDSAGAIARDMIADVGRGPALGYMLGRLVGAGTWPRARQAARIVVALTRA